MKNKNNHEFEKGYVCAVANLVSMYGDTTEAIETYRCNFLSVQQLKKIGVEERDIELLKPVIKEIERK